MRDKDTAVKKARERETKYRGKEREGEKDTEVKKERETDRRKRLVLFSV